MVASARGGGSIGTRALDDLIERYRLDPPVTVTRPTLPDLGRYMACLEDVWASHRLTNGGPFHERLEEALAETLGVKYLSLFCNGTTALASILQVLGVGGGEVVTTPFTFPATAHAIRLAGADVVFGDIDPVTLDLDPERVEALITPRTRAVLPVHVYGTPCDTARFADLSRERGVPTIYDGAHAFGVRCGGESLVAAGHATMLSFHATKLFSSVEGGALVLESADLKRRVDRWRNFGIVDEVTVEGIGTNGKLNELQAAFGLLQLEGVDAEIEARGALEVRYREGLAGIAGLSTLPVSADVRPNHAYMPVLVDGDRFGLSRDDLYEILRACGVVARRYFHPLLSRLPAYRELPSAAPGTLPVAERIASQVLCLPIYGELEMSIVDRILRILLEVQSLAARPGAR